MLLFFENLGPPLSPQDNFENRTFRVVQEFEDGQSAYGQEGLCVRAELTVLGQRRLVLKCSNVNGIITPVIVLAEHCAQVDEQKKKPRALFDFKRQSFDKKLRLLGRCGITDVMTSAPLEPVKKKDWRPEGFHIQVWMTFLEEVFPQVIGYNVDLLEALLSEDMEDEAEVEARLQHDEGNVMSMEKTDDESPLKVRYFDTVDAANEVVFEQSQHTSSDLWSGCFS